LGIAESPSDRVASPTSISWSKRSGTLTIGRGFDGKLEAVSIGLSQDETEQDSLQLDFAQGISTWTLLIWIRAVASPIWAAMAFT
jgi:hypothetical protein